MSKSRDPCHSEIHVADLISILDQLLRNEKTIATSAINFEILLPAIAWHDCWTSTKKRTINPLIFSFYMLYEGFGSAKIFKVNTRKLKVPFSLVKDIKNCIFHQSFLTNNKMINKIFKPKLIEAKILRDMDSLDVWGLRRQTQFKKMYCNRKGEFNNRKAYIFSKWGYELLLKHSGNFYFNWSKQEYQKRRSSFMKEAERLIKINERRNNT